MNGEHFPSGYWALSAAVVTLVDYSAQTPLIPFPFFPLISSRVLPKSCLLFPLLLFAWFYNAIEHGLFNHRAFFLWPCRFNYIFYLIRNINLVYLFYLGSACVPPTTRNIGRVLPIRASSIPVSLRRPDSRNPHSPPSSFPLSYFVLFCWKNWIHRWKLTFWLVVRVFVDLVIPAVCPFQLQLFVVALFFAFWNIKKHWKPVI